MGNDTNADQLLEALGKEVMKLKRFYDGSNRCTSQYEAFANAANGQTCLKTDYTYVGATTNVDAMKESLSNWDSSWDI